MFQFLLLRFPVRVHWTFGLVALFIGGGFRIRGPEDWPPVLVAMAVIFVSILVHELGHAIAGRRFGAKPTILLHSMGGLCYLPDGDFTRGQNILVSLAGPAAGFLLAGATALVLFTVPPQQYLVRYALAVSLYVNVVWTLLNLLPILPLDGGQVFRDLLGPSKIHITRGVGLATASVLAVVAFYFEFYLGAIMAAVLAFLNYQGGIAEGGVIKEAPPHENPFTTRRR